MLNLFSQHRSSNATSAAVSPSNAPITYPSTLLTFYFADEYKLARTKIAGLAQNKRASRGRDDPFASRQHSRTALNVHFAVTILFSTSILFILLIYLAGFVANGLLYAVEKRTQSLTGSPFEGASPTPLASRSLTRTLVIQTSSYRTT